MLKRIFFGKLPEHLEKTKEAGWHMLAPMMVLAGFTIVVGIYPDIFLGQIVPYMSNIVGDGSILGVERLGIEGVATQISQGVSH